MFRLIGDMLSPSGPRGKLNVLIYHRTPAAPDPILHDEIDAEKFGRHMALLAAEFNVIPLSEASARLARGALPARAVSITFDDGYADNEQFALPILKRYGLTATFFVSPGFFDGGIMFNDVVIESVRRAPPGTHDLTDLGLGIHELRDGMSRRPSMDAMISAIKYRPLGERSSIVERLVSMLRSTLPRNLMMNAQQIRHLHDEGMEIGCHTINHPILALLDDSQALAEIVGGKHVLEEIIDSPVSMFAYPNGKPGVDYGPRDVQLVKRSGFKAAVSTIVGVASRSSDMFQLPRFGPWDSNSKRLAVRLLMGCMHSTPVATTDGAAAYN